MDDETQQSHASPYAHHVGSIRVSGSHHRKPPVVFNPAEDVDDIEIHVPHEALENERWGERRMVFSQSAADAQHGHREWTHYVQLSKDVPRRLRMAMIHEHPAKHEPQYYTMEYTDYGKFKQNDPELVSRLPAEVYQAMLGMSVALREVKLMTLEAIEKGEFDNVSGQGEAGNTPYHWQPAPGIYAITLAEAGEISSQWEMGISLSKEAPAQFRAFARNVDTGQEVGLFTNPQGKFQPSHAGLKNIVPEEVYAGLVGLSIGCKTAREITLELQDKREMAHDPKEQNKNRGFCNRLRQERLQQQEMPSPRV